MPEQMPPETGPQLSNEQLNSVLAARTEKLASLLPDSVQKEERGLAGYGPQIDSSYSCIDLDIVGPHKRVVVSWSGDIADAPSTYRWKTDGYNPTSFLMPDGLLHRGATFELSAVHKHENNFIFKEKYGKLMPITTSASMRSLRLEAVDKTETELFAEKLRASGSDMYRYNAVMEGLAEDLKFVSGKYDELSALGRELPAGIYLKMGVSPHIKMNPAPRLCRLDQQGKPQVELQVTDKYQSFLGDSMQLIDGMLYLVDTATGLCTLVTSTPEIMTADEVQTMSSREAENIVNFSKGALF